MQDGFHWKRASALNRLRDNILTERPIPIRERPGIRALPERMDRP